MSFFEPLPPPPPEPPPPGDQPPWNGPPWNETGVSAGINAGRVHDGRIAFSILAVIAYSTGFEVMASFRMNPAVRRPAMPVRDQGGIRFGVLFSDGRKATTGGTGQGFLATTRDPVGPLVMPRGGSGGSEGWRQTYWVWPLPPPGPLVMAGVWTAAELPEVLFDLDAAPILEAAERSQKLW